ncbi:MULTISPECIES: hypothetical protein [Streptomyces violaceusniger group]|uniref:Uncharacterized protein n=2 Tax=Streptomyces rhizosphaericus TaxID=114699 RepID=A0ABN1P0X1_9ACTN|nr:hypothetical protein [Streptomyces indonesiensis]
MTAEFPPIDRDKSPLIDADHDPVRIADALRGSPHILGARAEPGSDRVTFTWRNADDPDSVVFNAAADLLEHIAGTWGQQDDPTRQRAVALALALGV